MTKVLFDIPVTILSFDGENKIINNRVIREDVAKKFMR